MIEQFDNYSVIYTRQQTLRQPINCRGVCLHSGKESIVYLCPATENSGVVFQIMNENTVKTEICAHISNVQNGLVRTVLKSNNETLDTVEHLLAALSAYNINNIIIKVWGREIPIFDGSSDPWIFLIKSAGIVEQSEPVRIIKVLQPVEVKDENSWCRLEPNTHAEFSYNLHYDHPIVSHQKYSIELNPTTFEKEIGRSRTFGFYKDLDYLLSNGLANGATIENTVVFDDENLMPKCVLRFNDEPVRHKILDSIGDLSLAGHPIIGKFIGHRSGHSLNHKLVKTLLNNKDAWRYSIF